MSDQAARPRRTAILGGALLIACALVWTVSDFSSGRLIVIPYLDVAVGYLASLLLLAAMIVLAVGVRGEAGAFGSSRLVIAAAIVFGARNLAFQVQGEALTPMPTSTLLRVSHVLIPLTLVLDVLFVAAIIVVAVAQTRGGRARQLELAALWAVSGAQVLLIVTSVIDNVPVQLFLGRAHAALLFPLCIAVLGVAYLLRGLQSGVAADDASRIAPPSSSTDPSWTPSSSH